MECVLRALRCAVAVALLLVLCGLLAIEREVRLALPGILTSAASAAAHFDGASQSVEVVSRKQSAYLDHTSVELNKTVADAHDLLARTDLSLNGTRDRPGLIPRMAATVSREAQSLDSIESQTNAVLGDLDAAVRQAQPIMASLEHSSENVQHLTGDPAIMASLDNLNAATGKANAALASLMGIAASGDRDAVMLETRLRQALKPATLSKSILMHALGIAGPATQVAAAVK